MDQEALVKYLDSPATKAKVKEKAEKSGMDPDAADALVKLAKDIATGLKEGKKTTEFWLTMAAQALGTLMMAGVFPAGLPLQLAGVGLAVIPLIGYIFLRTKLKEGQAQKALDLIKSLGLEEETK